jgi:hypothetical protein
MEARSLEKDNSNDLQTRFDWPALRSFVGGGPAAMLATGIVRRRWDISCEYSSSAANPDSHAYAVGIARC